MDVITPEDRLSIRNLMNAWKHQKDMVFNCCIPAIVCEYDSEDEMATVMPLVKERVEKPDGTNSYILYDAVTVTVRQFQHGSFHVHAPLFKGETGWLFASDMDSLLAKSMNKAILEEDQEMPKNDESLTEENGTAKSGGKGQGGQSKNEGPQNQQSKRLHDFASGFFMPDKWGGVKLPDEYIDALVIQQLKNDEKSLGRLAIFPDGAIKITSENRMDIDLTRTEDAFGGPLGALTAKAKSVFKGSVKVKKSSLLPKADDGSLEVEGDTELQANLKVKGNSEFKGKVKVNGQTEIVNTATIRQGSRRVEVFPQRDLRRTNAKFREIIVVTGKDENLSGDGKVVLTVMKMRALVDEPEKIKPIEIETVCTCDESGGGGGGGGTDSDDTGDSSDSTDSTDSGDSGDSGGDSGDSGGDSGDSGGDSGGSGDDPDDPDTPPPEYDIDGLTTTCYVNPTLEWAGQKIVLKGCLATFQKGLLVGIDSPSEISSIDTTPHSSTVAG